LSINPEEAAFPAAPSMPFVAKTSNVSDFKSNLTTSSNQLKICFFSRIFGQKLKIDQYSDFVKNRKFRQKSFALNIKKTRPL